MATSNQKGRLGVHLEVQYSPSALCSTPAVWKLSIVQMYHSIIQRAAK